MSVNMPYEQHQMHLVKTHSSGAEEWHCPTCGRRFLMTWPPSYKRIILEPGDELALHNGGKGGLQITGAQLKEGHNGSDSEPIMSDELRAELDELFQDIDFGD